MKIEGFYRSMIRDLHLTVLLVAVCIIHCRMARIEVWRLVRVPFSRVVLQ